MNANETSGQESGGRTDLEVTVCENGVVNVRRPESERAHSVMLDVLGDVVRCTCKGYKFRSECSHADAVESRPLVVSSALAAASTTQRVATDGGEQLADDQDESESSDDVETCDHCGEPPELTLTDMSGSDWNDFEQLCTTCVLDVGGPGDAPDGHNSDETETEAGASMTRTATGWASSSTSATTDESETVDETPL